ncbi:phytanoyl-CoA dioxygenase family protein [Alteromonas flava]|uniref:phytanoyl-CoA dioxygenase family protein n=1 Tax=Alteromonas flava TaxID=2048003 RepID=UPI000C282337|nr:phytanoyl-CoA dioxygenase family protein [Alteromonas flava]
MKYLFGIGVEKCGTSSMFKLLDNDPQFNTTTKKETFFFSKNYTTENDAFFGLFKQDPRQFSGYSVDITPSYFRNPSALKRIKELKGEKKILIMLRDPIKRAYSHYTHDVVHHFSTGQKSQNFSADISASFEDVVWQRQNYYLPKYAELVANAFELFGRDNVHVMKLEDLMQQQERTLVNFSEFLGLDKNALANASLPHANERKTIPQVVAHFKQSDGSYCIAQQTSDYEATLYSDLSLAQVHQALNQQNEFTLSLPSAEIEKLRGYYRGDIMQLANSEGIQFDINRLNYVLSASMCQPNYRAIDELVRNLPTPRNEARETEKSMDLTVKQLKIKTSKLVDFLKAPDRLGRFRRQRKKTAKSQSLRNTIDYSKNGQWPKSPELRPWFDQTDAKTYIAAKDLPKDDKEMLNQWVDNGFVIANVLDSKTCDLLKSEMENGIWRGQKRYPNLNIIGLRREDESQPQNLSQEELLSLPESERQWMQLNNNWRIHGMNEFSEQFEQVSENETILRIGSLLFDKPAESGFTLSFGVGSQQKLHQDYAQFHIYPRNYLIGCWIALEDIHPDSGPLEFYPGTHKLGYWNKHDSNYPQTNLRTLSKAENAEYFAWLSAEASKVSERRELIIKKGQALFWHACLAHGGSPRKDMGISRHSLVLHLIPKDMNVDKRFIINEKDKV